MESTLVRYSRQTVMPRIGIEGQKILRSKKVAVIGLGGTGSLISQLLVRLGVGSLLIMDRDYVTLDNLHRQIMYSEKDVGKLKVEVAYDLLKSLNSDVKIDKNYEEFNASNAESIVKDMDLVMDGTDNFVTRYIINDACVKLKKPWIYSAAISTYGSVMPIIPEQTACLRCILKNPPEQVQTCREIGVLNSVPSIIASIAVTEALKLLLNNAVEPLIYYYEAWTQSLDKIKVLRGNDCQSCKLHNFEFLTDKYYRISSSC